MPSGEAVKGCAGIQRMHVSPDYWSLYFLVMWAHKVCTSIPGLWEFLANSGNTQWQNTKIFYQVRQLILAQSWAVLCKARLGRLDIVGLGAYQS